jgi:hypothetical protein
MQLNLMRFGQLFAQVTTPNFATTPDVLLWQDRLFIKCDEAGTYKEATFYIVQDRDVICGK